MPPESACRRTGRGVPRDRWRFEREAWREGFARVAGVDEAGRGPLAGPVVAAAVILPPEFDPDGIEDSKSLSEAQRERAFERIRAGALAVGIGVAGRDDIDRLNILEASRRAMADAVRALSPAADFCLLDGLPIPGFAAPHRALPGGDALSVSISAASIVAKVTRDGLMRELDTRYPGYGFARNKGYGTPEHLQALERLGPCPEHRLTFTPCARLLARKSLPLELRSPGRQRLLSGAASENLVRAFLRGQGLTVLESNYRSRFGEIDVVALDGDTVCFVEVRSRRTGSQVGAAESVDARKRERIVRAARAWLQERECEAPCRFDVVEVEWKGRTGRVRQFLKDCFTASGEDVF